MADTLSDFIRGGADELAPQVADLLDDAYNNKSDTEFEEILDSIDDLVADYRNRLYSGVFR